MGTTPSHFLCSQRRDYFLSCKPKESHISGGKFCLIGAFDALNSSFSSSREACAFSRASFSLASTAS